MVKMGLGKRIGYTASLPKILVFLQFSVLMIQGTDITFHFGDGCNAAGLACPGSQENFCCYLPQGPSDQETYVQIANAASCTTTALYFDSECYNFTNSFTAIETGNGCFFAYRVSGALVTNSCRRRLLLGEGENGAAPVCKGRIKPTAITYNEDGMKKKWTLLTPDATELYTTFNNLQVEEKLAWLQSQGATYQEL